MRIRYLKILLIIPLITAVLTSTGCYDIRELDKISIVTGIAVDKADKKDLVELTVQIGKANAIGGGQNDGGGKEEPATQMIDAVDKSISGALDALRQDNSRTLFLHHNQILIFGKSQAEKDISSYLDIFMRDNETRLEVWILIAEGKAKDVLNTKMELEKVSAVGISRMVDNKYDVSKVLGVNLLSFISKLTEKTTSPVAPIIRIVKEEDVTRLSLTGMAVFKGGKMVGELSEEQSIGYAWLLDSLKSEVIPVKTEKGSADLNIISTESKIKPVFDKDGNPKMNADITGSFNIGDLSGFEGMDLKKVLPLLQKGAEDSIKKQIMSCYRTAQKLNADIYGFGAYINKYDAGRWKSMKDKWDQIFPVLQLNLNIKINILDTGKITRSPEMAEGR